MKCLIFIRDITLNFETYIITTSVLVIQTAILIGMCLEIFWGQKCSSPYFRINNQENSHKIQQQQQQQQQPYHTSVLFADKQYLF